MAVKIVNPEECIGCGFCVNACPQEVLEIGEHFGIVTIVNPDDCIDCAGCVEECVMGNVLAVE